MNESFKFHIILLKFTQKILAILFATRSNGESSTCVTVYEEGGAPAVFQSQNAPTGLSQITIPLSPSSPPKPQPPLLANRRYFISWSLSLSLSLWVFVVNCINTILFSIYWRNSPEYFHLFPFRPILVSCSEFSMAKDFFFLRV